VTEKDFALAEIVERTALWQAGSPFRPTAKFRREGA
jgi:hypothetical protein